MQFQKMCFHVALAVPVIFAASQTAAAQETQTAEHPLRPAIQYAKACLEKIEALPGYEATFYKKEVVGTSVVSHQMKIKVRHNPFSVYLLFQTPHEGREVIYVEGQNNGKLIAHEAGFLSIAGSMELNPTDAIAMNENRYPITKAGIANTLKIMIKQWEDETKYGETEVKYYKDAKVGNVTCRVIESRHPEPRRQFNNHMVRLWIDSESGLPVRMQKYGFPKKPGTEPPILEDYTFLDLKTDIRLTDADFDRNNTKYSF
jgi:outer membrane lipoprotein-sorting protein